MEKENVNSNSIRGNTIEPDDGESIANRISEGRNKRLRGNDTGNTAGSIGESGNNRGSTGTDRGNTGTAVRDTGRTDNRQQYTDANFDETRGDRKSPAATSNRGNRGSNTSGIRTRKRTIRIPKTENTTTQDSVRLEESDIISDVVKLSKSEITDLLQFCFETLFIVVAKYTGHKHWELTSGESKELGETLYQYLQTLPKAQTKKYEKYLKQYAPISRLAILLATTVYIRVEHTQELNKNAKSRIGTGQPPPTNTGTEQFSDNSDDIHTKFGYH